MGAHGGGTHGSRARSARTRMCAHLEIRAHTHMCACALAHRRRVCIDVEPSCLVGQRVKVVWDGEGEAFPGTIISFDAAAFTHEVEYEDGDHAHEFLALDQAMLPRAPPQSGAGSSGGGGGGGGHAWPAPSSGQLIALGALLTERVDAVEKEAAGDKKAGTARARSNAGASKAKELRTLTQEVMALADAAEEREAAAGAVSIIITRLVPEGL
jgi:hypothetical protein